MTAETRESIEALARQFLQESVFASREASHGFSPRSLDGASGCGLGLRPTIPDDFNGKQARLLEQMLSAASKGEHGPFASIREKVEEWIKTQDALDRKRNHFLRDFRQQHGFDRASYAADVEAAFKAGLAAINDENRQRLDTHAHQFAALFEV